MTDTLQTPLSGAAAEGGHVPTISGVEQRRILTTPIPGPRSQALQARKTAAVAAGVGMTLPVYVVRAGGGILVDADGNQLIDFGSGIAVTTVGNAAPASSRACTSRSTASPTPASWSPRTRATWRSARRSTELTPGDHEKRSALFNSGAEAVENAVKIARGYTGRDAVAVFDHAYHGRTNLTMAMTAKNMPYKNGFGPFAGEVYRAPMSYPFREPAPIERRGRGGPRDRPCSRSRSARTEAGGRRRSSRSRARAASSSGAGVPAGARRLVPRNGVLFVADEIQSGFAAPATVRLRPRGRRARPHHHGQGHRRRPAARRRHRPRRGHGLGPRRRPRRHLRRQPGRLRRRLGAIATIEQDDLAGAARRIEAVMRAAARGARRRSTR